MKDEINIDEFEEFLKTQADKHRMYPDDQVWRNINQQLHGNSRWPALTFAAFLTGAVLIAGLIFLHPNKEFKVLPISKSSTNQQQTIAVAETKATNTQTGAVDITKVKPPKANVKAAIYPYQNSTSTADIEGNGLSNNTIQSTTTGLTVQTSTPTIASNVVVVPDVTVNVNSGIKAPFKAPKEVTTLQNSSITSSVGSLNENRDNDMSEAIVNAEEEKVNKLNSTIQSDDKLDAEKVAKVEKIKVPKSWSLQIYGGSSVSYRLLTEPTSYDYHFPYNPALSGNPTKNVNNMVKQRPAIGLEIGAAMAYPVAANLNVRVGLQFNYRQYNIDAFASTSATPSVLWTNGESGRDSTVVYSAIRNGDGGKPISLRNRYFQIGIPIGLDWTIARGRKVSLSVGATVQPTYQLNTDMYMITSDYKGYVQQPDMIRRLNFNGGLEAMMNFKTGGVKWQVGPQVRYQMLPTQMKSYSVHEHLIDYGLKVGIIKQLK